MKIAEPVLELYYFKMPWDSHHGAHWHILLHYTKMLHLKLFILSLMQQSNLLFHFRLNSCTPHDCLTVYRHNFTKFSLHLIKQYTQDDQYSKYFQELFQMMYH